MTSHWRTPLHVEQITPSLVVLRASLGFFDGLTGEVIIAPAGFVSDGTTRVHSPRWLRWLIDRLIGHPLTTAYLRASILHDAEIAARTAPWWLVHTRYYRALRARTSGPRVGRLRALAMTTIVVLLGPRW